MNEMDYRDSYREDYRDDYNNRNYRDDYRDYRDSYRGYRTRDYDLRGGKINNRNYRNYRDHDFHGELEMVTEDMRELYRNIEDISEMATNQQEKNTLMRVAQKEKENYSFLKQMMEK